MGSIASGVEQQSSTTHKIANNVSQASLGILELNENVNQSASVSAEISRDIAGVSNSMNEMPISSYQLKISAQELSQLAEQLKNMVDLFKSQQEVIIRGKLNIQPPVELFYTRI